MDLKPYAKRRERDIKINICMEIVKIKRTTGALVDIGRARLGERDQEGWVGGWRSGGDDWWGLESVEDGGLKDETNKYGTMITFIIAAGCAAGTSVTGLAACKNLDVLFMFHIHIKRRITTVPIDKHALLS
ncbi:hypothetical protein GQX74_004264 [Glossina fuscipes]|nr:hypothetical protein GQX74_004264 [Glossina fuscipes]